MTTPNSGDLALFAQSFERAAAQMSESMNAVKADMRQDRTVRRLLVIAIVLDLMVTCATAVIITVTLGSNATIDLIKSCTNSNGECYKRNLKASAGAVNVVNIGTEAVAFCEHVDPKPNFQQLNTCVGNIVTQYFKTHPQPSFASEPGAK